LSSGAKNLDKEHRKALLKNAEALSEGIEPSTKLISDQLLYQMSYDEMLFLTIVRA
jgi:hypothetical protein